jgi:hypothetical protein
VLDRLVRRRSDIRPGDHDDRMLPERPGAMTPCAISDAILPSKVVLITLFDISPPDRRRA